MKNVFSSEETTPQLHEAFASQQPPVRPVAPSCNATVPGQPDVPLPTPDLESLARRSAPGHAASADLTYQWRR